MVGMKRNIKQTLEIAETVSDPRVKLQARGIANDCYRDIMDLRTNTGVISDALKYVEKKKEELNVLQQIDKGMIESIPAEQMTTTSGVFQ
jgi:predicted CopG family antitoxin